MNQSSKNTDQENVTHAGNLQDHSHVTSKQEEVADLIVTTTSILVALNVISYKEVKDGEKWLSDTLSLGKSLLKKAGLL